MEVSDTTFSTIFQTFQWRKLYKFPEVQMHFLSSWVKKNLRKSNQKRRRKKPVMRKTIKVTKLVKVRLVSIEV